MGEPWRGSPAWDVVERAEHALGQPLAPPLLDATEDALSRTRDVPDDALLEVA
jgi:[acyl-carrier-protein] S-malonyltransferase